MSTLILKDEVYLSVGAAMEIELRYRAIPFESQEPLSVRYKDCVLNKQYIADLLCFEQIIVEIKALDRLSGKEQAQGLNYLKATGLRIGLLINFGAVGALDWKRFIR